jgi:hypothetical protein
MIEAGRLPPLDATEAALRRTTETLALEVHRSTDEAPDWNEFEWRIACSVAVMQGISAVLARRLRWRGPPLWQDFLEGQRHHGQLRHHRAGELLAALDHAARRAGVAFIALKGSALRALPLHAAGDRPMSDVDLLVGPGSRDVVATMLGSLGYSHGCTSRRHDVFVASGKPVPRCLGEHGDIPHRIEVHTRIEEPLPITPVDITARLRPAALHPGSNPYACHGALMCHLLLHTAGGMRSHSLRLIQLLDIALLAAHLDERHWQTVLDWWIYPPLALAERCFPGSIPDHVLGAARARCPPLLRFRSARHTLFEVSWSNLRIAALPGYEWSRSFGEALSYLRSRLLPSRSALRELDEAFALTPEMLQLPWYGVSHGSRIWRWLVGRPPRVQTMMTVLAGQADA